MYYEVIPKGKVEALTYEYPERLRPGQVVLVSLGRRMVPGVVSREVGKPDFKTKEILKVVYVEPLPRHLLAVVQFIHDYYREPVGQAVAMILPNGVEKQRRKKIPSGITPNSETGATNSDERPETEQTEHLDTETEQTEVGSLKDIEINLNTAQEKALRAIYKLSTATKLLYGVTGSGKTNIYLKMALDALKNHKSTILLVPEIALTGQLVQIFRRNFGDRVILIHSQQTEAERHLIFETILKSEGPKIVIGPRSALFAPVADLGLVVIDEAHESSYYQENTPRYSAIRVASAMARAADCSLILGSATPMVEDFYLASRHDAVVKLTEKAKKTAIAPEIQVVDLKNKASFSRNRYFSNTLLGAIQSNLSSGRQTLIFHNRRGSAPMTICEQCGEEILCPNCFLPLTLHADVYELHCHTCEFCEKVPVACPKCGAPGLIHKGFGTKLLETELQRLFPSASIHRFDADNKRGEGMDAMYGAVRDGEVDILVGTQTIAKGLDLPKLATVGIVQADAGLSLPDYMAEERTFQLLTQVIGRVGRGHIDKAEVIVQTYQPEHPVLNYASGGDYLGFYQYLISRRKQTGFPPFRFVLKLEITMKTEAIVLRKMQDLARRLATDARFMVSPPMPAFHERTARGYTWQIFIRSRSRGSLLEICDGLDKNFRVTLDPPGLL